MPLVMNKVQQHMELLRFASSELICYESATILCGRKTEDTVQDKKSTKEAESEAASWPIARARMLEDIFFLIQKSAAGCLRLRQRTEQTCRSLDAQRAILSSQHRQVSIARFDLTLSS